MSRIPYYETDKAEGRHAEFLQKLGPHLNIYRMLANSESGIKGFARMGNALLHRCELDAQLRELAILRVGRLSRACQHPDNVWSLHGLHECLTRRGDRIETPLIKSRLDLALARCEVPVHASCFCRRKAAMAA